MIVNEQDAVEQPVLAHQVLGRRNLFRVRLVLVLILSGTGLGKQRTGQQESRADNGTLQETAPAHGIVHNSPSTLVLGVERMEKGFMPPGKPRAL